MTSNKVINIIIYWGSVGFLVFSIISYIIQGKQFSLSIFTGTDALTLYGMIIALLNLIAMKSKIARRLIRKILMLFNTIKFEYEISSVLDTDLKAKQLYEIIDKSLANTDQFNIKGTKLYKDSEDYYVFSSSAMSCSITIKSTRNTNDFPEHDEKYTKRYKLEFEGTSNYKDFKKNTDYILNILYEELQKSDLNFNKYYVRIKDSNPESNLLNENYQLVDKNYKVTHSEVHFKKSDATVNISKHTGITINSTSKGNLNIALDLLGDLLMN